MVGGIFSDRDVQLEMWRRKHDNVGTNGTATLCLKSVGRHKGYGWVVTASSDGTGVTFHQGDTVYDEDPVLCHCHMLTLRCCWCCANCIKVVGSLRDNLDVLLQSCGKTLRSNCPFIWQLLQDNSCAKDGCRFEVCSNGCGERFCLDENCQQKMCRGWHSILCIELDGPRRAAWSRFKRHASKNHEGFLLAAKAYGSIIYSVKDESTSLKDAAAEFSVFKSEKWHELGAETSEVEPSPCTREERLKLCKESFRLLQDVLSGALQDVPQCVSGLDFDFFCYLLGSFDLVNVNIEFDNRLNDVFWGYNERVNIPIEEIDMLRSASEFIWGRHDDGGAVFPPIRGWGLYPTVSMTNHSCEPNGEVSFQKSAKAVVTAMRSISFGEEIVQSYIDESAPLALRQRQLQACYRFTCSCRRCVDEALKEIHRRRN